MAWMMGRYREYRVSMQFLTSKLNYPMLGRSTIWPIPTSPKSEKGSADLLASILGLDIAFQARAGVAKLKPAAISFSPKVWAKTRCLAFQCSSTKAIRNRLEAKGQNNVSSNTLKKQLSILASLPILRHMGRRNQTGWWKTFGSSEDYQISSGSGNCMSFSYISPCYGHAAMQMLLMLNIARNPETVTSSTWGRLQS